MGNVWVIGSSKGGVGKTSNSIALAAYLARLGYRVACVDADPNQALANWHRISDQPDIDVSTETDEDAIVTHLIQKASNFDVVFCDTGGWLHQTSVFSFGAADIVIVPVMPDRASVIEARRTARKIESVAQIARRDIPYRVLLSRWTPRGLLERATLSDLQAAGLPCFRQHIPNLTAFAKASFSGESPTRGSIALALGKIIDELTEIGALKAKGRAA